MKKYIDMNTIRLLGVAQLIVFFASLLSEQLLKSVVGSRNISDMLVNFSKNIRIIRISNVVALVNSLAIIALGVLFYVVLNEQNRALALLALGCFLAEAITLAVSKIGTFSLVPLSLEYTKVGASEQSYYQVLGNFLYNGIYRRGYDIHMLFFCVGGFVWYSLLYTSKIIPTAMSIWGMVAIGLLTIPVFLGLMDKEASPAIILGLPYAPYELVLGIWLIVVSFR